jgi:hypothetical protein
MKVKSLIHKFNLIFICHTTIAIYHCLSALKPGEFSVPPEIVPEGGTPHSGGTRIINHSHDNAGADVFWHHTMDLCFCSTEV